jgi:hypothetical protein
LKTSFPKYELSPEVVRILESTRSEITLALNIASSNYEKNKKPPIKRIVLKIDSIFKLGLK